MAGVIVFVVTDSPENARDPHFFRLGTDLVARADDVCLIVPYYRVTLDLLRRVEPWAVFHSGCSAEFHTYDVLTHPGYREATMGWGGPQMGFCGGFQILASFFGSTLRHMGPVRDGEADHNPSYHPGLFKEWGVYPVLVLVPDPIFEGLGEVIRVQEFHMDEVEDLGSDLELLASSDRCRVQAFRHRSRPIYGTQFHPEQSPPEYPDGFRVLDNFIGLARRGR